MASKKRKEKLKDIIQDADGNLLYTGDLYRIAGDAKTSYGRRAVLAGLLIIQLLIVILSGLIDAAGTTNAFYVILPYVGEVSALFALAWTMVKVLAGGDQVRTYVLDNARGKVAGETTILMVFAGFGFIMSAVYLIRNGMGESPAKSILYLAAKAASAGCAAYYRKFFGSTEWEKTS